MDYELCTMNYALCRGWDEAELFLFEVGVVDLYAYGVAELIAAVVATADELIVFLVELVVVVVEVAQMDEAFAVVLVDFAIDAIRLYA